MPIREDSLRFFPHQVQATFLKGKRGRASLARAIAETNNMSLSKANAIVSDLRNLRRLGKSPSLNFERQVNIPAEFLERDSRKVLSRYFPQAWQEIIPIQKRSEGAARSYDIVGPICETGDFLGKDRNMILEQNDLLAVRTAGAYGFVLSSNYNTRPRVAEVMVDGENHYLIRRREEIQDLFATESILPN